MPRVALPVRGVSGVLVIIAINMWAYSDPCKSLVKLCRTLRVLESAGPDSPVRKREPDTELGTDDGTTEWE